MKENDKKSNKNRLAIYGSLFILMQFLMLSISTFFAGGGHGTGIPIIIFYGPLLSIFKLKIFENTLISFISLFLIFVGFFAIVYLKIVSKKILKKILISYILIVSAILLYTELSKSGLGVSLKISIKLSAFAISTIISFISWKILFITADIKCNNATTTR